MLTTVAFAAALSLLPGQEGGLALSNGRATYGVLGLTRADTKFLPGDTFFFTCDVNNAKTDADGQFRYSMAMDVVNSKGKVLFKQEPRDLVGLALLGGNRFPVFAHVDIGLDQPAGEYTLKLTITDRTAKTSKTIEQAFEVLSPGFGIVQAKTTVDPQGVVFCPSVIVPGQNIYLNFDIVGFARDKKKMPNVAVEMRLLDDDGKPTTAKPLTFPATEAPATAQLLPIQFTLVPNRTGKFTIDLKVKDNLADKTSQVKFPITVVATK